MDTVTVTLLKPFVFSRVPAAGVPLPKEQQFRPDRDKQTGAWVPTLVEIPVDVADHPWVKDTLADGAIEDPKVTKARLAVEDERRAKQIEADKKIQAMADAALRRAEGKIASPAASDEDLHKELNTPANELGTAAGADIDKKLDEKGKKK